MKRIISITLCLVMLLLLVGCTAINEGEVYEKEYREAYTTTQLLPLNIYNGKTFTTVLIPYVVTYPDRYVIHIKAYQDEEWVTEDFYVSKDVYDTINIGDMFIYDESRGDLRDEPYTKEREDG